jgi:phosphatidylinositol alpha-1,6-mannosyltransferase
VPAGFVAWWIKRSSGLPYVVTSHGSDVLGYNPRFRFLYPVIAPIWKRIVAEAALVTAASRFLSGRIVAIQSGTRVLTIANTVTSNRFEPCEKRRKILVVGRFVASKAIGDIIEALKTLDLRDWHVDVVGDGPLRAALERQAADANLSSSLTFHGWLENGGALMRDLYARAFLFVSASRIENMSVALLEALAAGCRIVTTNVGGSAELGGSVRFFVPGDVASMRELIAEELRSFRPGVTPPRWTPPDTLDTYASVLAAHAR